MKSRSGFVSNSSSSSFIIIGAKMKLDNISPERMMEFMDKADVSYDINYPEDIFWDALYNDELDGIGYLEEGYVGMTVARWDDCDGITEISFEEEDFMKTKASIKKIFGRDVEVKVYAGMTYG